MNKKKFMSMGVFFIVVALGLGITYDIAPSEINVILGIGSGGSNSVADADLPIIDAASSSFSSSDTPVNVGDVLSPPSPAEDRARKERNTPESRVVAMQNLPTVEQGSATSSSQSEISSAIGDITATTSASLALSPPPSPVPCSFPVNAPSTTKEIILNEIAWMGSASSSNAEWIELKNNSSGAVDLSGWELMNASGKLKVSFSDGDSIAPGGFFLLARASSGGNISGTKIYSGDLVNAGDVLALMDLQCGVSDYLDASHGWPGGNNTTKATMERDADGGGWHTSALPGGTPGAENSAGPPPAQYRLTIAYEGSAGGASIASDPAGLVCSASCVGSFASGTQITLTPKAGASAVFSGWSGLCYGETACSFPITATTSLTATFNSTLSLSDDATPSIDGSGASGTDAASDTPLVLLPTSTAGHILIAAVQIAGASSSNDLVKLYNPTGAAVDMSGWKLHKRSATGADYSLKAFPAGSTIATAGSFTWANSENGFSETVGADVSSTETLSADNSVALLDAAGNVIDAVAWGTGTGQYGEGPPYPTSPGANQMLSRRSSGGAMADTENNADDFTIQ